MESECSSFSWETKNGLHLLGRTYDQFGNLQANRIAVIPRGYSFSSDLALGTRLTGKLAFAGMAILGFEAPIIVDGLNEGGLMGALLHYPRYAVYDTQKKTSDLDVHPGCFITLMLSQCTTVSQVAQMCSRVNITGTPIQGKTMEVHYIFSDLSGETIIIEPDAAGITVHRNSIGVLTNSPDYLWHRTNLCNYAGVTNLHKPPQTIVNYQIAGFGEGLGGSFGLPGDYSSPSRFVRTAFLKQFAVKGEDETEGITKMFHNFAAVDIPEGILNADPDLGVYEQTLCICAMCGESLTYYFAPAENRRISALRLGKELNSREVQYFDLPKAQDIAYIN